MSNIELSPFGSHPYIECPSLIGGMWNGSVKESGNQPYLKKEINRTMQLIAVEILRLRMKNKLQSMYGV